MERYIRVPEGQAVILVSQELAAQYAEWTALPEGIEVLATPDPTSTVIDVQVRQTTRPRRHEPQTETR